MAYDLNKWVLNERKPVRRRKWVPAAIGGAMAMSVLIGILEGLDGGGPDEGDLANLIPLVLPFALAIMTSPFARDAWVGPREADFDEFESQVIARASRRALNIGLFAILAIFAWLWLAATFDWPRHHTPLDWSTFGLALFFSGAALPILLTETMVPIPPESDDAEADEEDAR
jgi:hypothetical protein